MSQFLAKVFAILGLTRFISRLIQMRIYSVNTRFTLTKERLALNKERFMHIKSP